MPPYTGAMPGDPPTETRIHRSADIDPSVKLGAGVTIGPGVIVGPDCTIGDGTRVGPNAVIVCNTAIGCDNTIHAGAILGDDPQDRAFDAAEDAGQLIVGDRNIIREHVTFHRGASGAGPTRVGSDGFFMACSHVGHNSVVGDSVVLTNHAVLAGHVRVGNRCVLSAYAGVHQFCEIGEYAMFQAGAIATQHVPPYTMMRNGFNQLAGINVVGLRRSGNFSRDDITEIREVYRLLLRCPAPWPVKLERVRQQTWRPPTERLISFVEHALALEPPRTKGVCAGIVRRVRARINES